MASDSSLGEAMCQFNIFCEGNLDRAYHSTAPDDSSRPSPSATLSTQSQIQDHSSLITRAPELRLRYALPEPQNADTCQQAEQSASQAIQQASQQASQAIQQASQQASQSIQQASQQASQSIQQASQQASQSAAQASQSASQAIQQAQQSASQSIADLQRSVSSVMSSASSAISSIQASAANALSQVNGQMQSAQISASAAQSAASKAILQAGAAVAAATGSAGAAGSSFLSAAAKATQSAQASASAVGAAASSQVAQASLQASASQTQAITATQAALAIVGSIIASALITIAIYFLITRHREKARRLQLARKHPSSSTTYSYDPKIPIADQCDTTIAASQSNFNPPTGSTSSYLPSKPTTNEDRDTRDPDIKISTVTWNPAAPPKPPRLKSWLKLQDEISPFEPIRLPTDGNAASSLGYQLKHSQRAVSKAPSQRLRSNLPLRSPTSPVVVEKAAIAVSVVQIPPKRNTTVGKPVRPLPKAKPFSTVNESYQESKASVWTDDVPDDKLSPVIQSQPPAPKEPVTVTRGCLMRIPSPKNSRITAEWMTEHAQNRDGLETAESLRPSYGFGSRRNSTASRSEMGYVQGLNQFKSPYRGSALSRRESNSSYSSGPTTPGVGKAF